MTIIMDVLKRFLPDHLIDQYIDVPIHFHSKYAFTNYFPYNIRMFKAIYCDYYPITSYEYPTK